MATLHGAQLRADTFLLRRPLPQVVDLINRLKEHIQPEVMEKVETDAANHFERGSWNWFCSIVRYLSRVTADEVWVEAVAAVLYPKAEEQKAAASK